MVRGLLASAAVPRLRILLVLSFLTMIVVIGVSAFGGVGTASVRPGVPKGADFLAFYTGAAVLEAGHGDRLYDRAMYRTTQDSIAPARVKYYAVYPPPLYQTTRALLPLGYERAVQLFLIGQWLLIGLGAYLIATAVPELGPWRWAATGLLAASPFAFMNTLTGQGAGFWFALLGGGVLLLRRRRPLAAGIVLGLLCAKPSLALAVAGCLTLTGQWRALAGFALGGAALLGGSMALGGVEPWIAWVEWMRGPVPGSFWPIPERQMTWRTLLGWPLRSHGLRASIGPSAAGLALLAGVLLARRRPAVTDARWPLRTGLVLSVLLLGLPHMIEYDLGMHAVLSLGIAAAVRTAPSRTGIAVLVLLWIAPALFPISTLLHVALGPLILTAAVLWGARRG